MRMGSSMTFNDLTQYLVIAKEDYENFVSVIMKTDVMDKVNVLR